MYWAVSGWIQAHAEDMPPSPVSSTTVGPPAPAARRCMPAPSTWNSCPGAGNRRRSSVEAMAWYRLPTPKRQGRAALISLDFWSTPGEKRGSAQYW
ncbi:hypothetical protein GMST_00390 [Geomonas silvestris]|uniref:Uncharacterized protein n=1 Tax=Geomonas silvestris TaxID=2740184 RepID=A0A6V8MCT7_9BACT|nr:hypothetical protein GMST_00390 [Geomonas silvestris]